MEQDKTVQDAMSRYQFRLLRLRQKDATSQWLTPSEAGQMLALSTERIRQLIRQNKLPALRTRQGPFLPTAAILAIARVRQEECEAAMERAREGKRKIAV